MTPVFTVLLPHKLNDGNNAALAVCIDCLTRNTRAEFAVSISAAYNQPLYATVNRMVEEAPTDCCFYLNSDMFVAPDWDTPMLAAYAKHTFVTNVVVEPGAIGVHPQNLHRDFGRKPQTFRRAEFEAWSKSAPLPGGEGWYAPIMFARSAWIEIGGFDTSLGEFPNNPALDMVLFEKWKAWGRRVVRARSFVYHLQHYSDPAEQNHPKREAQG